MKNTVLALALAVLPAAHAVEVNNFCYVAYQCYKSDVGAGLGVDNTLTDGTQFNGGATTAADILNCKGGAAETSTYLSAKGKFDPKGGATAAGTTNAGTGDCLKPALAADTVVKVATAGSESNANNVPLVPVQAFVGRVYTNNDCSTALLGADDTVYDAVVAATTKIYGSTQVTAAGIEGAEYAAAQAKLLIADRVISAGTTAGALSNADKSLTLPDVHDIGLQIASGKANIPALSGSNWNGQNLGAAVAPAGAASAVCEVFDATVAGVLNSKPGFTAGTIGADEIAPYALTVGVAAGKTIGAYPAAPTTNAAKTGTNVIAPVAVTAACEGDTTATFLTVSYHKTDCSGGAPTWTPTNTNTTGKLSCFAAKHIKASTCTGTDACESAAVAVLKHLTAESATAAKACGKLGSGWSATNKSKGCSKACLCPDTHGKPLNWAVQATADFGKDGACFLSADNPGRYNVDMSAMSRTAVVKTYAQAQQTTATGKNGDLGTLLDMVFTQMNTLTGATHGTADEYHCNNFDVKYAATATTDAEKTALDNEGYSADHDALWTSKGCGYTAPKEPTGASTKFAVGSFAAIAALVGAALF